MVGSIYAVIALGFFVTHIHQTGLLDRERTDEYLNKIFGDKPEFYGFSFNALYTLLILSLFVICVFWPITLARLAYNSAKRFFSAKDIN